MPFSYKCLRLYEYDSILPSIPIIKLGFFVRLGYITDMKYIYT